MTQNAPADSRMLVDDAMWVDLVRAGFERENVVWYYKADTDSDVQELAPDGWRDYDYVITTDSMRTFPTEFPTVRQAIENSAVVASFGEGAQKVEVRLVDSDQAALAQAADDGLYAARSVAGQQVLRNPDVGVPAEQQDLLTSGVVDGRILLTLGQLSASGRVDVADITQLEGDPPACIGNSSSVPTPDRTLGRMPPEPTPCCASTNLSPAPSAPCRSNAATRASSSPSRPTSPSTSSPAPPTDPLLPPRRTIMFRFASPTSPRRRVTRIAAGATAALVAAGLAAAVAPAAHAADSAREDGLAWPTSRPTRSPSTSS